MKIKLIKFREDLIEPSRRHYNDAGADLYSTQNIIIKPSQTVKIPLGFGLELPDGMMACIYPRSSLVAKGLISHIPPVDSGYRGEIHAILTNLSDEEINVNQGDRIAQLIVTPVHIINFVTELGDERNKGAFGSTGIN